MPIEDLLTEVRMSEGKLLLSFRNHGSVRVKWKHKYSTEPLEEGEVNETAAAIQSLGADSVASKRVFKLITFEGNCAEISCKLAEIRKQRLRQKFSESFPGQEYEVYRTALLEGKINQILKESPNKTVEEWINKKKKRHSVIYSPHNNIIEGNYLAYAKRKFCQPGTVVSLSEGLSQALQFGKYLSEKLDKFFASIKNSYHNHKRTAQQALEGHAKTYYLRRIQAPPIIADFEKLNDLLKPFMADARIDYEKQELCISIPSLEGFRPQRQLTPAEFFSLTASFIDVEIPRYETHPSETSWVGMARWSGNNVVSREIGTIHRFKSDPSKYRKRTAPDVKSLVDKATKYCRYSDMILAFCLPFDAIRLREAGDFDIGLRETEPVFEANTIFFERIGVHGKIALDLHRWASIAFDFLPNQKLETVYRHITGKKCLKELGYKEMRRIEEELLGKEAPQKGRIIKKYLEGDVEAMLEIYDSRQFRQSIEDLLWIAETFGCSFARLFHSQLSINEAQEWLYFDKVGTWRQAVYPHTKVRVKKELEARQKFRALKTSRIKAEAKPGMYENVWQVYVPAAHFFRDVLHTRFGIGKELAERITRSVDNQQKYFLSRYEDALCRWILHDYVDFLVAEACFEEIAGKTTGSIRLQQLCNEVWQKIPREDEQTKHAYRTGRISQKRVAELSNTDEITKKDLTTAIRQYALMLAKSHRLSGNYLWSGEKLEAKLEEKFYLLDEWCRKAKVLFVQGDYLYVQAEHFTNAPVIPVAKHKVIITADKRIHYEISGAINGIPERNEPYPHMNLTEMNLYSGIVREILSGNKEQALEDAQTVIDAVSSQNAIISDLVFYSSSSRTYWAFDSRYKEKIAFVARTEIETKKDEFGSSYFEEKGERVYVMPVRRIMPNYRAYAHRIIKKAEALLSAAFGTPMNERLLEYLNRDFVPLYELQENP